MIIDLTHTITPDMPMYPGSAAPTIEPTGSLTRNGYRETRLTIASHTGTHMDAPSHMLARGSTLEVLPAFRRRGVATALMNSMANWCLERGFVPFSQIWMDNQASFALHRSLGWSLSPQPLYWVTQD